MVINETNIDKIIDEYLINGLSNNLLANILQINPNNIFDEYVQLYNELKETQKIRSIQEYKKCVETPISTQINFGEFEQIDKWINFSQYRYLLTPVISILREIGKLLGPEIISNLQTKQENKFYVYSYDFFTKKSVQPNFLTLQKILHTFGFGKQIFSSEFKTFFTCGHKPFGLINTSTNTLTITWNVDTINEFMKKLDPFRAMCDNLGFGEKYTQFKSLFAELKNFLIQTIIRTISLKWIGKKFNVILSLQECDYELFVQIKKNLSDLFVGMTYSPQNTITFKIDDLFDFASNPTKEKIYQTNLISDTIFGFVTLSTTHKKLSVVKVFNSLILNHEKKSKSRRFTFTTRGTYIPELKLYNLHLKSSSAYKNLLTLEKYHIEKDISCYKSIYEIDYNFTDKSYTQIFAAQALITILPYLEIDFMHDMIDQIYERKYSFDQILLELTKTTQNFNCSYSNILGDIDLTSKQKYQMFSHIVNMNTFVKAINIHYLKKLEHSICSQILKKVIKEYANITNIVLKPNADLVIKEFLSTLSQNQNSEILSSTNLTDLTICGDINMLLVEKKCSRIKKYSFNSTPNEDEPFNHLLNMRMNSLGNDVIFSL